MFPAIAVALRITTYLTHVKSPARLANELDFALLPRLPVCFDYFIVERLHYWRKQPMTAEEFQGMINGAA